MTVAVMQPYFMPYIGYFQLVKLSDSFVFFDDVNFIKRGFIHRNKLLLKNAEHQFTIPLNKASQNKLINEIHVGPDFNSWKRKFFKTIELAYASERNFQVVFPILEKTLAYSTISEISQASVELTADLLKLNTNFQCSSKLSYNREFSAQEKILSICENFSDINQYVNPEGGYALYDHTGFETRNITLKFIKPDKSKLLGNGLKERDLNMSMLHLLFIYDFEQIREFVGCYTLFDRK